MAKTAYKAIRRRDNTPASFEQFKKELSQTNEIVKESMEIMHTLKILCKHGDLDISYGSVIFCIRCRTLACVHEIWKMYTSGSLQSLFQKTFVTTDLLEKFCVAKVRLKVEICEKEYRRCLRELGKRRNGFLFVSVWGNGCRHHSQCWTEIVLMYPLEKIPLDIV